MPVQPLLASGGTPELKAVCLSVSPVTPTWIEEEFNSYHKLLNITAWCLRFLSNTRASIKGNPRRLTTHLEPTELESTEHHLFHISQATSFPQELSKLSHEQLVSPSSSIVSLSPYIDKHGLIRVGGRLSRSHLSHSQTHPIILSGRSRLCHLICLTKHVALSHCGPSLLLTSTGRRLHIVGARRLTRSICRSYVTCRRSTAHNQEQMMGQLPSNRVTPSPPFTICGLDYAGPFLLKRGYIRKPQIVKSYLCVFVCFSTKAVHLEVVSDTTTAAFLECLVSRRGSPHQIHSDNGSNFRGAKTELHELYKFMEESQTQTAISTYLLSERITWHSTPERAPHFGGLWEAAVKSAKTHLKRIIGDQRINFEELTTVAAQMEACLNSRPLISTTSHSLDGVEVLTPGHFIIGRPLRAYPENPTTTEPSLSKRWSLCQTIITHFWRRWSSEYLQQLQRLQKWHKPSPNMQVGDIVLILGETTFTNHWPMAKVVEVHPDRDGLVRVVTLKTSTSILKRPVAKLSLLLRDQGLKESQEKDKIKTSLIFSFLPPPPQYVWARSMNFFNHLIKCMYVHSLTSNTHPCLIIFPNQSSIP